MICGLTKIDKSLLEKCKLSCYQHGLLPRLSWLMLMYDISTILSAIERIQKLINRWLQRWLGVPQRFSEINLYSTTYKLQLPLNLVVEECKVTEGWGVYDGERIKRLHSKEFGCHWCSVGLTAKPETCRCSWSGIQRLTRIWKSK